MKISKVDNTRMAVSENNKEYGGVLYKAPGGRINNLTERVSELNGKAARLYKVFNDKSFAYAKGKDERVAKVICGSANEIFKGVVKDISLRKNVDATDLIGIFSDRAGKVFGKYTERNRNTNQNEVRYVSDFTAFCRQYNTSLQEQVESLVEFNLRKSLAKEDFKSCAVSVLMHIYLNDCPNKKDIISEQNAMIMLNALKADILKEDKLDEIVKSIELQNTKVQPINVDGETLLALANYNHPKKKYVFEFLVEYANADKESKETMLVHMRKLILLYVCGTQKYMEADDIGISAEAFCVDSKSLCGFFDSKAYEKIQNFSDDKLALKKQRQEVVNIINERISLSYREAISTDDINDADRFWLMYIQGEVSKILIKNKSLANRIEFKLDNAYLCKRVWDNWKAYVAGKFIDLGKGVYHFVLPDVTTEFETQDIHEVKEEYKNGISSFDYENIKATESLDRDIAIAITSAENNFSRAVMDVDKVYAEAGADKEDILLYKAEDYDRYCKKDCINREILQYFSGKSKWTDNGVADMDSYELFELMKNGIYELRNQSFHYSAQMIDKNSENSNINVFCDREKTIWAKQLRKRYYSNNVPQFYSNDFINRLMDFLYSEQKVNPAQIPAFNRIVNKEKIKEFSQIIKGNNMKKIPLEDGTLSKLYASLLFVLKEIYYNAFICDDRCMSWVFDAALQNAENEKNGKNAKNARANDDFVKRIRTMKDLSFGEVCQQLMTDMAIQNGESHEAKRDKSTEIYKHYRTLLYNAIYMAFKNYLTKEESVKEILQGVREPVIREKEDEDAFVNGWACNGKDDIASMIENSSILASWYITAHFMQPKQLNHLIGSFKNYVQFKTNILLRENCVKSNQKQTDMSVYNSIVSVLEFVLKIKEPSGNISDYFDDEEEYSRYLANFIDYEDKAFTQNMSDVSYSAMLKKFCYTKVKGKSDIRFGLYYDASNPILNRNVIISKMYGGGLKDTSWWNKITQQDIEQYYNLDNQLSTAEKGNKSIKDKGKCELPEEQEKLREYMNLKNRVELLDVMRCSEIINSMYSQLISWSYLRERDLMYMQLGVAYIGLYFGDKIYSQKGYDSILGRSKEIHRGALLYQIAAMYNFSAKMFCKDNDKVVYKKAGQISSRIGKFCQMYEEGEGKGLYLNCLELFEDTNRHDAIVDRRNAIDHFKYFINPNESMLDWYSFVYRDFFTYDRKYQKSVTYILTNILAQYFIEASISMNNENAKGTKISIANIHSMQLSFKNIHYREQRPQERKDDYINYKKRYKLKGDVLTLDANSFEYIEQVKKMLEYKL